MKAFLLFLVLILGLSIGSQSRAEPSIKVIDADGISRTLNQIDQITVIIYSNPAVQSRTRLAGKALDSFQGKAAFRSVVVVDLRGSMANWATGYTTRRMVKDLDQEALRITPFYRQNGNLNNPRNDVSAVADFKGNVCLALGWEKPANKLRIIIFNQKGKNIREWADLKEVSELTDYLKNLIL